MDRHEDAAPLRGQPRLLDQVRNVIRRLHYSIRTEQAYVGWVRGFILYLPKALHPCNPGSSCSTGSGMRRICGRPRWRRCWSIWPCRASWPTRLRTRRRTPSCSCTGRYQKRNWVGWRESGAPRSQPGSAELAGRARFSPSYSHGDTSCPNLRTTDPLVPTVLREASGRPVTGLSGVQEG
jgi:hypothetical protein